MAELGSDFEDTVREPITEDLEQIARNELGPHLKQTAEENFKSYASRNGYDIDHIWEDAKGPIIERNGDGIVIRIEWPGLTALFEHGVDPHTIEGNPLLSFVWEGPPEGTRPPDAPKHITTDKVNWGSVTGGIPESRAIRDALEEIRQVLS